MSILCPHCNFEIMLVGVRPGRFSPKCQSCGKTFTLYVAPGEEKHPMAATSHLELHEMCVRMGKQPPRPFPAGALSRPPRAEVRKRELVGATSAPPASPAAPAKAAIMFDMLGETDTVDAITEVPKPASPQKNKTHAPKTRAPIEIEAAPATIIAKRRPWVQFKNRHMLWFLRRFGTPLDWIFARWLRVALGVMILAGFSTWWMQNKGDRALQQVVQSAVIGGSGNQQPASPAAQQNATSISPAGPNTAVNPGTAIMTSQTLEVSWLSDPLRRALSGWNACLAGMLILTSVFGRGRLFCMAIILAAAIAMIGHWYTLPQIGQPLPWMTAATAGAITVYACFALHRPRGV